MLDNISRIVCAIVLLWHGIAGGINPGIRLAQASTDEGIKLPYGNGQAFVVVQGYDAPPTHIKKDLYAIDFSENACDAYGKSAVAALSGKILLAEENGYNGGYGTQVLINNGENTITRYAHLIPGTIPLFPSGIVHRGQTIGEIGNTGLVAGFACPAHPGTHIHFAMYDQLADGTYAPRLPEPISQYVNIHEGAWYVSDNVYTQNESGNSIYPAPMPAPVAEATSVPFAPVIASDSARQNLSAGPPTGTINFLGGVSAAMPSPQATNAPEIAGGTSPSDTQEDASSSMPRIIFSPLQPANNSGSIAEFNSSTLAIDFAWIGVASSDASYATEAYEIFDLDSGTSSGTPIAVTTSTNYSYTLSDSDFGGNRHFEILATNKPDGLSVMASATVSLPDWSTLIQPIDTEISNASWYGDNWYDIGTGFYGTIRSLTLEGFVDNSDHLASQIWLDEYLDANYSVFSRTFTISDDAPFSDSPAKITFSGMNIPLQPNKYYRLRTYQNYQNRSVILMGTHATGTAMWNSFIYGTGRTETQYSFYPYFTALMIPDYPPLQPPDPVQNIIVNFDSLDSLINVSWPTTTDPDTTSSLLTYQVNDSTSTELNDADWRSTGKALSASIPVEFGDSYVIGVRAIDDLGNISKPVTVTWNFPDDYVPVPAQLDHSTELSGAGSAQSITFAKKVAISGIALWTVSDPNGAWCCGQSFVTIHDDASGSIGAAIASSSPVLISFRAGPQEEVYDFSPEVALAPGIYWFELDNGPSPNTDATWNFGSASDSYPGGVWSGSPGQDSYFRIEQASP